MRKLQKERILGEEPPRNPVNDTHTRKFYTSFDAKSKVLQIRQLVVSAKNQPLARKLRKT